MVTTRFVPLIVLMFISVAFLVGLFWRDDKLPSMLIGRHVPPLVLSSFAGDAPLTAAHFQRGTPLLLNVWASWCVPCRIEHPILMRLARDGVMIIGLNYKDNITSAQNFLNQFGNPYTRIGRDTSGQAAIDLGVYGVPETFVIDGGGIIRYRHVGVLDDTVLTRDILPLLGRLAPSSP